MIRHLESPTNGDSREPELNATPDGKLVLSWVEKLDEKRYALRTAISNGSDWSETYTVAQGDNWFINWADFPSVIALDNGSLAAHWLVKSGSGTYAYNVNIARSNDGGKTWTKPMVPHLDNTQTEHGFVSLVPLSNGMLGAVWLDGRNMKDMKDHEEDKPLHVSMTLRYAAIDAQGNLSDEAELDERVCECCQTSAAVTSDGAVAVYRDRSHDEVRDIYSVRQDKSKWQLPKVVHADNWTINGCPVMDQPLPPMDVMSPLPGLQGLAAHRTSTSLFPLMLESLLETPFKWMMEELWAAWMSRCLLMVRRSSSGLRETLRPAQSKCVVFAQMDHSDRPPFLPGLISRVRVAFREWLDQVMQSISPGLSLANPRGYGWQAPTSPLIDSFSPLS